MVRFDWDPDDDGELPDYIDGNMAAPADLLVRYGTIEVIPELLRRLHLAAQKFCQVVEERLCVGLEIERVGG